MKSERRFSERHGLHLNSGNIGRLIEDLDRQFPGFREQLLQDGDIKPSIAVSIDGEMGTGGVLEPVCEDSEVFFLPAIGGG